VVERVWVKQYLNLSNPFNLSESQVPRPQNMMMSTCSILGKMWNSTCKVSSTVIT
jgi:hypothetical protein